MSRKEKVVDLLINSCALSDLQLTSGRHLTAIIVERDGKVIYLEFPDGSEGMIPLSDVTMALAHNHETSPHLGAPSSAPEMPKTTGGPKRVPNSVTPERPTVERTVATPAPQTSTGKHTKPIAQNHLPTDDQPINVSDTTGSSHRISQSSQLSTSKSVVPLLSPATLQDLIMRLVADVCGSAVPSLETARPTFEPRPINAILASNEAKQLWQNAFDCIGYQKSERARAHFISILKSYPREAVVRYNLACVLITLGEDLAALAIIVQSTTQDFGRLSAMLTLACCRTNSLALRVRLLDAAQLKAAEPSHHLLFLLLSMSYRVPLSLVTLIEYDNLMFLERTRSVVDPAQVLATIKQTFALEPDLPSDWVDPLMRAPSPPSSYLSRVEDEEASLLSHDILGASFTANPHQRTVLGVAAPTRDSNEWHEGELISFNAGAGWGRARIDGSGEVVWVSLGNTADSDLKSALQAMDQDATKFESIRLEFQLGLAPIGAHLRPALKIRVLRSPDQLADLASSRAEQGVYSDALRLIRSAIGKTNSPSPKWLAKEMQWSDAQLISGLPKGTGPYSQAKRAHLVDKDLQRAVRLLEQAVEQRDNYEGAVKDLANLYQQLQQPEKGIALLKRVMPSMQERITPLNVLATLYQHSNRHQEAIPVLEELLYLSPRSKQSAVRQRIALSCFKIRSFERAESELNRILAAEPYNQVAAKWLTGLKEAQQTGDVDALMVLVDLAEDRGELPEFSDLLLEECNYEGVKAQILETRNFSERDVAYLEQEAKRLGIQHPRDRGRNYLSAAKILSEIEPGREDTIQDYVRRALSSFGYASVTERKDWDVARTYWCEAFSVTQEWGSEPDDTLAKFLLTALDDRANLIQHHGPLRAVIPQIVADTKVSSRAFDLALYASLFDATAGERALRIFYESTECRALALRYLSTRGVEVPAERLTEPKFIRLWEEPRRRLRERNWRVQERITELIGKVGSSAGALHDVSIELLALADEAILRLDVERLRIGGLIAKHGASYFEASSFVDRQRSESLVKTHASRLLREIQDAPTQLSRLRLYQVVERASELVEQEWAQYIATARPDLTIDLAVDNYHQNKHNDIQLQLEIRNVDNAAPASGIRLQLQADVDYCLCPSETISVTGSLQGGDVSFVRACLRVTPRAIKEQGFDLQVTGSYREHDGTETPLLLNSFAVRLHEADSFVEIKNKFKDYAKGGPVLDETMFKGRDALLQRLVDVLGDSTAATKCVALFGQKRTGKTSVLIHLRNRLKWPTLAVSYSLGIQTGDDAFDLGTFLYDLLERLHYAVDDARDDGHTLVDLEMPSQDDLRRNPVPVFDRTLKSFRHRAKKVVAVPIRIVFLLDEFTYLYTLIKSGQVPRGFMQSWKALLQEQHFSAVLIGQDVMPQFIDEFPNELKTTEDIRLDYLDRKDALSLMDEPMRVGGPDGETRYRRTATQDVLDLTAQSPFYIQLFCSRLVEYMNENQAPVVTPSDIQQVLRVLVEDELRLNDFDNLLSADNHTVNPVSAVDALQVLRLVATRASRGGCTLSDFMTLHECQNVASVVADLEKRRVLKERDGAYSIRVGLLREWFISHPDATLGESL